MAKKIADKVIEEKTGTGRRKRAIAAVRLRPGTGKIDVNGREFDQYFPNTFQRQKILMPLKQLELEGKYDLIIRAKGGGIDGQADAARLGIARALVSEQEDRRGDLKSLGFLRRDPRRRERKKYGHKGARKSFQFSKR
jgi:small subunit ribosomal protein S9